MDYLEQLDEAIKKAEEALGKRTKLSSGSQVSELRYAAGKREDTREKKFTQRAAVRKMASRAGRFTIRESDLRFDMVENDVTVETDGHMLSEVIDPCTNSNRASTTNKSHLHTELGVARNENSPPSPPEKEEGLANDGQPRENDNMHPAVEAESSPAAGEPGSFEPSKGNINAPAEESRSLQYQSIKDSSTSAGSSEAIDLEIRVDALFSRNSVLKSSKSLMSDSTLECVRILQDNQQATRSVENFLACDKNAGLKRADKVESVKDLEPRFITKRPRFDGTRDTEGIHESVYGTAPLTACKSFAGPGIKRPQFPSFHCTTVSNDHLQSGFDKKTLNPANIPIQAYSFRACTLQNEVQPAKTGRITGPKHPRPKFTLRSFKDSLSCKIRSSENERFRSKSQKITSKALKLVLDASRERQMVIKNSKPKLVTAEANEVILEILQVDKALNESIRDALEQNTPEIGDQLDLLMDDVRGKITELDMDQRSTTSGEDGDLEDGAGPSRYKYENEMTCSQHFSSEEHLDSEPIMEFERAIVRCLISLSKEEINDTIRKYSMFSRNKTRAREAEAVMNDRVFRNYLGLQIAKSIHSGGIKTVIERFDEYRNFAGAVIEIINRGSLDMDERFVGMITRSVDKLQSSTDPFTCKMAVQSVLCRKYVEDSVELKKLLMRFSSLDI